MTSYPLPECQGDPVLAKLFAEVGAKPPMSKVVRTDVLATAHNVERLPKWKKIVDLSCGHKAIVRYHASTVRCKRCAEMYRHGFDMDGFYKGLVRDTLIWREDPVRAGNEPTDLGGNFIEDGFD